MASLLEDMVAFLIEKNVVEEDGVDIFRDFVPEGPDSIVILYEYTGSDVEPLDIVVHRSVQITVRNTNPTAAREKSIEIFDLLNVPTRRVDFTETRWGQVYIRQSPFKIGIDDNHRTIYGFNIGITTTKE